MQNSFQSALSEKNQGGRAERWKHKGRRPEAADCASACLCSKEQCVCPWPTLCLHSFDTIPPSPFPPADEFRVAVRQFMCVGPGRQCAHGSMLICVPRPGSPALLPHVVALLACLPPPTHLCLSYYLQLRHHCRGAAVCGGAVCGGAGGGGVAALAGGAPAGSLLCRCAVRADVFWCAALWCTALCCCGALVQQRHQASAGNQGAGWLAACCGPAGRATHALKGRSPAHCLSQTMLTTS